MTRTPTTLRANLDVKRLPSGYWHVRGVGPCNWAQWPVGSQPTADAFFPEASDEFKRSVLRRSWPVR